jgi:broad specificity phosphatase PhoE
VRVDPSVPITDWGLNDTGRRRAEAFAWSPVLARAGAIVTSEERKARETAGILAGELDLDIFTDPRLGENDRSATGFLPPEEFEAAADRFFARSEEGCCGWERAIDAQKRIVDATRELLGKHRSGDLVIVSHGAVGTLLLCALTHQPIDRRHDQPFQGHYWRAPLGTLEPMHGWRPF